MAENNLMSPPTRINRTPTALRIPPSPLMSEMGFGTGATVYMLQRSKLNATESPWAVKKINKDLKKSLYEKRLCHEAQFLKELNHPNIVGFRSFSKNLQGDCCLAMEACDESLGELIEERADENLGIFPAKTIIKVATDVSAGLNYLHSKQILHGDLKSYNILIKNAFEICKICDFGVSQRLNENGELINRKRFVGTGPWNPPEAFNETSTITSKADMFAFGLVLWEMFALQIPHCEPEKLADTSLTQSILDRSVSFNDESLVENYGTRPPIPEDVNFTDEYSHAVEIFYLCTMEDPSLRLTALQVLNFLKKL